MVLRVCIWILFNMLIKFTALYYVKCYINKQLLLFYLHIDIISYKIYSFKNSNKIQLNRVFNRLFTHTKTKQDNSCHRNSISSLTQPFSSNSGITVQYIYILFQSHSMS